MIRTNPQRGYILLPVVLLITLVASSAFLLNNESALDTGITASNQEAKQAEYVAKAGLQHALWHAGQQGCGPYTDLAGEPLGNHSYTTTLTTSLGSTSSYTISVDQDTWIRSDQPTVNKGSDSKLHIRFEGGVIERPMYRYDLSPIAANSNILSATAWFYVSKEHPEGPVDIHLLNADWTETDATWDTMGDKMNAAIQATIPTQPVAGVWVAVNLTSQVQAWVNGQPNFGITLNSLSEGTHGDYASIEAAEQPYLEVIVGTPPTAPATLQSVGTLGSGISRTLSRDAVTLNQLPSHRVLQHGADKTDDGWITGHEKTWSYGASTILKVNEDGGPQRGILRFDLGSAVPQGARVTAATLELYADSVGGSGYVRVYGLQKDWVEGSCSGGCSGAVTWNTTDGSTNWTTPGSDADSSAIAEVQAGSSSTWHSWDVTSITRQWVSGERPNHGVLIQGEGAEVVFNSSDHSDANTHPKLILTYRCPCGVPCVAPQGAGKIAFIGDLNAPDADDQLKIGFLESWGYQVDFYEDRNSDSINWSNYDLAYISETVVSGDVSADLPNIPIGVVNEEPKLYNDLELASGDTEHVGSSIDITDNSHYITSIFPLGPLSIYERNMQIITANTPLAGGLQTLGEYSGAASLTAIDRGAPAISGTAVGRRVTLPLGQHVDSDFNWTWLNHNALLLVQRAVAWGMGEDVTATGKDVLMVVSNDGSLTTQEQVKKALIESWGHTVNLIDEDDNQAVFDAAVLANEVVFIPEDADSNDVGTKLVNASIGVVTEEANLIDEFGLADDIAWESATTLTIDDNSHYITSPFSTDPLQVMTSSVPLARVTNPLSPDLLQLASLNSDPMLVALESGAATHTGGTTAGRRVLLPWGDSGFDLNDLNADGRTIMQRAIEWASSVAEPKQPIAHWKLDETSGTTAVDSEGGHDGSLVNGPLWTSGQVGGALDFDGVNDHVRIPHDDALSLTESITISAWVNASSFGNSYQTIVAKDGGGAVSTFYFGTWRQELVFGFFAGSAFREVFTTGLGLQAGNWYHLAATFDNNADSVVLYVDGVEVHNGAMTFSPSAVNADASIGRTPDGEYWRGRLDDVRIYDDLLGADDIAELATPPGPFAHWRLDETAGTTAIDSEGGHHGTLTNGPAWIPGQVDGGLEFDGTDDFINVPHDDALSLTSFSISAWIRPASLTGWKVIVNKGTTTSAVNYYLATDNDEIGLGYYNAGWVEFNTTSADLTSNQWYHVLASYDDASRTGRIYLDGTLVHTSTVSTSPLPNSDALTIGRSGFGEYWTGIVDDVRIYNRVLSDSEAADIAGGGGSTPLTGCDGTFRDEFNRRQYDQSDGTLPWATNWEETGESTNPTGGDIRIDNDTSDYQLMLRDDGQTVWREADLSEASSATLSFEYRRENLQNGGDYVAVEVSYNGGSNWTELDRFAGNADDATYTSTSYPLDSAQLSATTRIRFKTPGNGMKDDNQVWFDNIQIQCTP